jgi:hypothetical protein
MEAIRREVLQSARPPYLGGRDYAEGRWNVPAQAYEEHLARQDFYSLTPADATAFVGILTGGGQGDRYDALTISNDDTTPHIVEFRIDAGGPPCYLGSVVVPGGAGLAGVPAVDALAALQVGAIAGVLLLPGIALAWRTTTVLYTGTYLTLMAVGGSL